MTFRCSYCGDSLTLKQVAYVGEGRIVIGPRNANKKVSPDRYFCMDCHAAAEYQQHRRRQADRAALLADIAAERGAAPVAVCGEQCPACGGYDDPDTHDAECLRREQF